MESPVIIVSDDDPLVVNALTRLATKAGLWVVPDTHSQVSALARMVEPTVIILDINQGVNGLDLLAALKASPETRDCPVIMCTAHGDAAMRKRAFELGAEGFELKPVEMPFILGLVRRAGEIARQRHLMSLKAEA